MAYFGGTNSSETIVGTDGADTIHGRGGDDHLLGGNSNDYLIGGDGDDTLDGGNGDDRLVGADDDDLLIGGTGSDLLDGGFGHNILEGGIGDDIYIIGYGTDEIVDTDGYDKVVSYTNLNLADFEDIEAFAVDGNSRRGVTATGTDGEDIIGMSSWMGVVDAGAGNDQLSGSPTGSEVFIGGLGRDVMDSGFKDLGPPWWGQDAGIDRFDFRDPAESAVGAERDVILNFLHSDSFGGDQVNLGFMDANTTIAGNQAFTYNDGDFTGTAGELRITTLDFEDDTLDRDIISGDVDGDGVADFEIEVQTQFNARLTLDNDIIL